MALGTFLQGQQQRVAVLHGKLDQRERNRVMGLLPSGRVKTLIATDLAARGLDVPGVQRVFNFDLPRRGNDYLHRTGRAGEASVAISLVGPPEWNRMESIARSLNLNLETRAIKGLEANFKGPTRRKKPSRPTAGHKRQLEAAGEAAQEGASARPQEHRQAASTLERQGTRGWSCAADKTHTRMPSGRMRIERF
ncbi:MAG: helicase-related protein [Thermochromatium sp.]